MKTENLVIKPAELENLLDLQANILLIGPPGIGKTFFVERLSKTRQQPLFTVCCNEHLTPDDLLCAPILRAHPEHGSTESHFIDGPILKACKTGGILYLDELDRLPPNTSSLLHSLLDHRRYLGILSGDGHSQIHAHPSFRVIATANKKSPMDPALVDRFISIPFQQTLSFEEIVSPETSKFLKSAQIGGITIRKAVQIDLMVRAGLPIEDAVSVVFFDGSANTAAKLKALLYLGEQISLPLSDGGEHDMVA